MENFDSLSFWLGLALGLINGVALVCFTCSWRWAGLPPAASREGYNINPAPTKHMLPEKAPPGPPPAPSRHHHLTVELRHPPRHPDWGPDLRSP